MSGTCGNGPCSTSSHAGEQQQQRSSGRRSATSSRARQGLPPYEGSTGSSGSTSDSTGNSSSDDRGARDSSLTSNTSSSRRRGGKSSPSLLLLLLAILTLAPPTCLATAADAAAAPPPLSPSPLDMANPPSLSPSPPNTATPPSLPPSPPTPISPAKVVKPVKKPPPPPPPRFTLSPPPPRHPPSPKKWFKSPPPSPQGGSAPADVQPPLARAPLAPSRPPPLSPHPPPPHPPLPPSRPPAYPGAPISLGPEVYMNFTGDSSVEGNYEYAGLGYSVAVHLVVIPGSNKFLFMERPSGRHPDKGNTFIAGVYNLDRNSFYNVKNTDSLFCAGHTLLSNGNILVVGGHLPKTGFTSGLKSIRIFDTKAQTLITIAYMRYARWYPTATLLSDGRVLIMGGTQLPGSGTQNNPFYELWDPLNPLTTTQLALSAPFVKQGKNIYYPVNYVLPTGHLFSYCNQYGNIINPSDGTVITVVPSHTQVARTVLLQYPYSATSVLLPLTPENNYTTEVVFFGGQYSYGWTTTPAVHTSMRLKFDWDNSLEAYVFNPWVLEEMNISRVMGDAILLPNGVVILLNGAQEGVAGDSATGGGSKAQEPAMQAVMYDSNAILGRRYTPLARTGIARMYHSTAALTTDGTVLVSGCDRCNYFTCDQIYSKSPTGLAEYRVEVFYPPFYYDTSRPGLTFAQPLISYQVTMELGYDTYSGAVVTAVVLVAPSSTTHSFNTHQRVVGLQIVSDDGQGDLVVMGPPNKFVAPPGMYMVFLLNGQAYSQAAWVTLA